MICPRCDGTKQIWVLFILDELGAYVPCADCDATGRVDDRYLQWRERGAAMRQARMLPTTPYENMANTAKRLGIDLVRYSRMERGLEEPLEAEAAQAD